MFLSLNVNCPCLKLFCISRKFLKILSVLYQKDDELTNLLKSERREKEDLSFQVGALAHDVKTPLTVLKGNLELLEFN